MQEGRSLGTTGFIGRRLAVGRWTARGESAIEDATRDASDALTSSSSISSQWDTSYQIRPLILCRTWRD